MTQKDQIFLNVNSPCETSQTGLDKSQPSTAQEFISDMAYDIIVQQSTLILSTDWHRRDLAVAELLRIGSGLRT